MFGPRKKLQPSKIQLEQESKIQLQQKSKIQSPQLEQESKVQPQQKSKIRSPLKREISETIPEHSSLRSVLLSEIKEVANKSDFWREQGTGLFGSSMSPTTVDVISDICNSPPTTKEHRLIQVFDVVQKKIQEVEKKEKNLRSKLPNDSSQQKLDTLNKYKQSMQYEFYLAIEYCRTAGSDEDVKKGHAKLLKLSQNIDQVLATVRQRTALKR